jgi:signal transduction histidine kinase
LGAEVETAARSFASDASVRGVEVAVRTGWSDGRCAVVLARRVEPAPPGAPPGLVVSTAALLAALLAAVWVAAGPTVRRVRRLTSDVRRSAATRYESRVGVTGGDEISDLARAFNEAAAEVRAHVASLEKREQTLRAFLANTTHDVMLPLTVLQGHLSTMKRRVADGEPVHEDLVLSAIEEAHYMASLVHNLGAVAKLDAGEPLIQRHRVDLNALVERVVERHRPVARPRGIELNFAVPEISVEVEADVTLIEQAVGNVVANAVRYNRSGGHVAVILELRPGGNPGFSLRVVDDGPGVSEEQLLRLSERNYRGDDARTRHPAGLGLGLHIARDVALRHGFALSFARSEYGGLEVTFAGPLAPGSPGGPSRT